VSAVLLVAGCGGGGSGTTQNTQTTPTITAWPAASTITYGQSLALSTLTGGRFSERDICVDGGHDGADRWQQNESVIFTPSDIIDYTTVMGSVTVTVGKATPTVSAWPAASTIAYGQRWRRRR